MSDHRDGELADELHAVLSERLAARTGSSTVSLLGAGRDLDESLQEGRTFLQLLAPGGWSTPGWPTEHGGQGLDHEQLEVFSAVLDGFERPDLYPFLIGLGTAGPMIIRHGTPAQQRRYLEPIRYGNELWCQLFSEPDAGSDLVSLRTRATVDGDHWRVTGHKLWASRASIAHWGLLLARTEPDEAPHRSLTVFIVDMSSPGVTLAPIRQMNGDTHFFEVFLDGVILSDEDRIGPRGGGWRVAMDTLGSERASAAALGGRGLDIDAVRTLLGDGTHMGERDPVLRDQAARVIGDLMIFQSGAGIHRPEGHKVRFAHVARSLAALSHRVGGAQAMIERGTWTAVEMTAPSVSIRGGTDEVQRNVIGERVLGLPRESPRPAVQADHISHTTSRG